MPSQPIRVTKPSMNSGAWTTRSTGLIAGAAVLIIVGISLWLKEPASPSRPSAHRPESNVAPKASSNEANPLALPDAEHRGSLSVNELTGGQPLEQWLKNLIAQDDQRFQWRHLADLFDALKSPEDVETALNVMNSDGSHERESSVLIQMLAELDPMRAIRFAKEQRNNWELMATVMKTWAKSSPDAALAWARQHPGPADSADTPPLGRVIVQLARTDLDRAFSEAAVPGPSAGPEAVFELLNQSLNQRGWPAAVDYAERLPEGPLRDTYIEQLAGKMADTEPETAADWAMQLPSGKAKRESLGQVAVEWMNQNPQKATAFVNNLPISPDADEARIQLAEGSAFSDVAQSLALVRKISDPQSKWETISQIARNLAENGLDSALEFVAKTDLPRADKARISKHLNQ
jgi:hypothetical protein